MPDAPDFYCDEILSGKTPVMVVAETDRVLAFEHVFRSWERHVVVIPKQHVRRLSDVDDPSLMGELMQVVIAIVRERNLVADRYKVVINGGSYQSNQHLHVHLVAGAPIDAVNPAQRGELAVE